ncbi:MAG: bifunctional (p)ppGpp synthetase/guanosine-3',5'-bis(diphosphate) 3'-pyrophosphohydrolase [Coriobacteriia bacterium]|nr:bifunctional (p)ppGpp synthetase/guanosine-3',5'-bis(diphosphate) 3'-pyrophosphohydrolase [Coriobacteriia bacterium]MCL2749417.1 bifunctional (p)ppGpp synthetase/guanosine-3',5'-bis(diphosphate) 3'-pyrophosphohydrolase [Coriobacteriia bacterium]
MQEPGDTTKADHANREQNPVSASSAAPKTESEPLRISILPEDTIASEDFSLVIEKISSYMKQSEIVQVEHAYQYACDAHVGQLRKTGEAFITHPVQVSLILAELRMDVDTLTAAILHDTVEDSSRSLEEIEAEFSTAVMVLVDGVTKITRIEVETLGEQQARNLRKMLVAMSRDIRVIVIKLADRLHNMRTLQALREDRRIFKARETMEIYAPLAHRLGISSIKWELEDLSFYYLDPLRFSQIQRMVSDSRDARESYLHETIELLEGELKKENVTARITGRPKHLYSIYQKMAEKGKDFSEIYDLIALRVIVDTVAECYTVLGAVHTLWSPMPGRFKDYIAMPKFNMYQSLHTTVIGTAARPLEIQIRTKDMHNTSEYGVAAHWRYKDNPKERSDAISDEQLMWLHQMLDWADETTDPSEFLDALRLDLNYTEVFVFSPKGEVINLRTGSTPIDFAYAIHTEVGNQCIGAKVNASIVPLSYELQTGDRVEILTQKGSAPSRDWLSIVKTPSARQKIRSYFSKASRSDDILRGRELLAKEMRKHGLGVSSLRSTKTLAKVRDELGISDNDELMAQIGSGKISQRMVANKLLKILVKTEPDSLPNVPDIAGLDKTTHAAISLDKKLEKRTQSGVLVKGLEDVLVRLAQCCNPVPGDGIIGFVTRGRGVSVHRVDCPNADTLRKTPERMIEVSWQQSAKQENTFNVEIIIEAIDRLRLLQDVTVALVNNGVNILGSTTVVHSDGIVDMRFLFELGSTQQIRQILDDLQGVDGVIDAKRTLPGQVVKKNKERNK